VTTAKTPSPSSASNGRKPYRPPAAPVVIGQVASALNADSGNQLSFDGVKNYASF
jgi:hypothetical protein